MSKEVMLTTIDNPFDPFEQVTSWFMFDVEKGYNTCSKLMRIAQVNDDMSEVEKNNAIDSEIDTLIKYDFLDIFKKVERTVEDE